jgi:hypothetical protein
MQRGRGMKPGSKRKKNMNQYETSVSHEKNTESGLTVVWNRNYSADRNDECWSVVCYSDNSRWFFDNASGEQITLLGEVADGLNKAEILETNMGTIIALCGDEIQTFSDRESWLSSLCESDKPEAESLLLRA